MAGARVDQHFPGSGPRENTDPGWLVARPEPLAGT